MSDDKATPRQLEWVVLRALELQASKFPLSITYWWIFASRIRDIGWPVAPNIVLLIVLSAVRSALERTTADGLAIVVALGSFAYAIAILALPGAKPKVMEDA